MENTLLIIGFALFLIGTVFFSLILMVFIKKYIKNDDDPESEPSVYEKFEASDGKIYYWPVNQPRSSRKKQA